MTMRRMKKRRDKIDSGVELEVQSQLLHSFMIFFYLFLLIIMYIHIIALVLLHIIALVCITYTYAYEKDTHTFCFNYEAKKKTHEMLRLIRCIYHMMPAYIARFSIIPRHALLYVCMYVCM